jgi:ubiquinone biosynthesis protein
VARIEIDGSGLAEQLFGAYLQQILVDGFFHADPHPGNVFLTEDRRLALLDLGMVGRVSERVQEQLLQLLLAVSEGRADDAARLVTKLAEVTGRFDERGFGRTVADLVGQHQHASLDQIRVGEIMLDLTHAAGSCGLRLVPELTMLGKTLLNLDEVGRCLDPGFDPNASIRRHSSQILQRRLLKSASPGNLFSTVLEVKEFAERLTGRVNKILDRVANNDLRVTVDAIDEAKLMAGFQKIANRITLGLLLAALIVGAAMLMQVETAFRILGYPALAIIFFLLAAGGGVALVLTILFKDE